MNLISWDEKLRGVATELREFSSSSQPTPQSDDNISQIYERIRSLETEILRTRRTIQNYHETRQSKSQKINALLYWCKQCGEKFESVVQNLSRLGTKQLWLEVFRIRLLDDDRAATIEDELVRFMTMRQKIESSNNYLSHRMMDLEKKKQEVVQELAEMDTERTNNIAIHSMHSSELSESPAEVNALNYLQSLLSAVHFSSHRSNGYKDQLMDSLTKLQDKLTLLLESCREIALDGLDFEQEQHQILVKQNLRKKLDELHLIEARLKRISDAIESISLPPLHPVLKKRPKKAKTGPSTRFKAQSLDRLAQKGGTYEHGQRTDNAQQRRDHVPGRNSQVRSDGNRPKSHGHG